METVNGIFSIGLGKLSLFDIPEKEQTDDMKRFAKYYEEDFNFYVKGAPKMEESDFEMTSSARLRKETERKQMHLEKSLNRFMVTDGILEKHEQSLSNRIKYALMPNSSHYDINQKLLGEMQRKNAYDTYSNPANKNKFAMLRSIDNFINSDSVDALSYLRELIKSELPKNAQGIQDRKEIMQKLNNYFDSKFGLSKLESELKWIKQTRANVKRYTTEIEQNLRRY